jgi:hypothetical protein
MKNINQEKYKEEMIRLDKDLISMGGLEKMIAQDGAGGNKKTKKKWDDLVYNENFIKDVKSIRKKFPSLVKENKKTTSNYRKSGINFVSGSTKIEDLYNMNPKKAKEKFIPLSENFANFAKEITSSLANKEFNEEVVSLCMKYKVYPIDYWQYSVAVYILVNEFFSPDIFYSLQIFDFLPEEAVKDTMIRPDDINFALKIIKNKKTKENELYVQIFETTTSKDIKKNWKTIVKYQKKLREEKDIKKRFYPSSNLKAIDKIKKLRKDGLSDWEIQEEIYGSIENIEELHKEKKRKNKLHQLIHRSKKSKDF